MRLADIKRNDRSTGGCIWDFQTGQRVDEPTSNLCLLVAERDNPKHRAALARLQIENVDALRKGGEEAMKVWSAIQMRAMSEAVLLGWWHLDGDDGQPLPYSPDAAEKLLSDPALWPFRHFVEDVSSTTRGYVAKIEEDAKGN